MWRLHGEACRRAVHRGLRGLHVKWIPKSKNKPCYSSRTIEKLVQYVLYFVVVVNNADSSSGACLHVYHHDKKFQFAFAYLQESKYEKFREYSLEKNFNEKNTIFPFQKYKKRGMN